MEPHRFETVLEPHGTTAAVISIPKDVSNALGGRARISVRGTLNGVAFRNSIMPSGGDGPFYMAVNRALREAAKAERGDTVRVELARDDESRTLELPADLAEALDPDARRAFDALSYSHQKEYVDWVLDAKKDETRQRRIAKTVAMVLEGRQLR